MAYEPEAAQLICEALAEGQSLRSICKRPGMPKKSTVLKWCEEDPEFRERYAQARVIGLEIAFDELLEIADDEAGDVMEDDDGRARLNIENVHRAKLRIDTRKWILSKLLPKKYGERLALEHTNVDSISDRLRRAQERAERHAEEVKAAS